MTIAMDEANSTSTDWPKQRVEHISGDAKVEVLILTALPAWAIFNTCGFVAIMVRLVNLGCPRIALGNDRNSKGDILTMLIFNIGSQGNFNLNAPQTMA